MWELPNFQVVRTLGTASFGGVASARGLARMYAVTIGPVDGAAALLTPQTLAMVGQIQSIGHDVVLGEQKAFTLGFHATCEYYPQLGQGSFGHSGAGGQQAFADPRNGIAYGYTRRRTPLPRCHAAGEQPPDPRPVRGRRRTLTKTVQRGGSPARCPCGRSGCPACDGLNWPHRPLAAPASGP